MQREIELAWAAGLFDGEGNICASGNDKGLGLKLIIGQSNSINEPNGIPEVLQKFQNITKLGSIHELSGRIANWNKAWIYMVSSEDAITVFDLIYPWLSSVKRLQGKLAIEKWKNRPLKQPQGTNTHYPCGHERSKENTYTYMSRGSCRACSVERKREYRRLASV